VIDKSGSMQGENMEAVKKALRSLAGRLTAEDRVMIVAFDDESEVLLPATSGDRLERILAAIDSLVPDGGTNIEEGLKIGFDALAAIAAEPSRSRRLMLFTDAVPNAGRTDSTSFRMLTERYASLGIGLSTFGVGVDFGQELVYHISQLRGGNFFFLESAEKIARVFDTEFDYLVTPLVYDLRVKIETPAGMKLTAVYGLPTWKPGSRDAELHVPTVFLSSNRGAIVLRYEKDGSEPLAIADGEDLAYGTLGFTDVDGRGHSERTVLRHAGASTLEPGTQFYTHDGMRMAVALTNIYFGLRDACILMTQGKKKDAIDALARAKGVAMIENITLMDEGLAGEISLLDKLEQNIEGGAATRVEAPSRE
jgi:Ca-activated chloride channel family protein